MLDLLAKRREELGSQRGNVDAKRASVSQVDSDAHERLSNVERSIIHIINRLDRVEQAAAKNHSLSAGDDDILATTERMLREILFEMIKQQNIIEKYRQENDSLREKLQLRGKQDTAPLVQSSAPQPPMLNKNIPPTGKGMNNNAVQSPKITQRRAPDTTRPNGQMRQTPPKSRPLSLASVTDEDSDEQHSSDNDPEPVTQRAVLPVEYPSGYNQNRGRRFSVAGESFNPNTDATTNAHRNIIKKPEEVKRRIRGVITNNILFKNLDEDQLEDLIDEMFEIRYRPNEIVIRQGDDGDNFYVVDSGELYILYNDVVVATIGQGKSFGEIALMYMCPRTATVKAKTECIVWGMSRSTFRRSLMIHAIRKRQLYESFLARVPLLETLLPYERSIIADALESRSFQDGAYIIRQRERGDTFYILEKGKAVATKGEPPVEVKTYEEGDYFGELALLTDQPRAANVRAVGPVRVLCLNRGDFANLMGPCEDILKRNMQLYNLYEAESANANRSRDPNSLMSEFVQDETNYLHNLAILVKEFLVPMRKAAENSTIAITPEEVAQVFSNLEMLLNIHNTLANELSSISGQSPFNAGKLFNRVVPGLNFYKTYHRDWRNAQALLEKYKNVDSVANLLKAPNRLPYDLYALLRAPIDRLQKYSTFLKELQAAAPGDKEIVEATNKLDTINEEVARIK